MKNDKDLFWKIVDNVPCNVPGDTVCLTMFQRVEPLHKLKVMPDKTILHGGSVASEKMSGDLFTCKNNSVEKAYHQSFSTCCLCPRLHG
jgi:uncharacterized protein (UPF0179 family)